MVEWAFSNVPPTQNPSILEVGTGNGTLLFALLTAPRSLDSHPSPGTPGYQGSRMCGIDYSAGSVKLARSIAATTDGGDSITFAECDFLTTDPPRLPDMPPDLRPDVWDLLLDKGTFDAIALGETDDGGKSPAARYPGRVARLLKPGGSFLITCAWPGRSISLSLTQSQHVISLRINCEPTLRRQKRD